MLFQTARQQLFLSEPEQILVGSILGAVIAWRLAKFAQSTGRVNQWLLAILRTTPFWLLALFAYLTWLFASAYVPIRWSVVVPWLLVALLLRPEVDRLLFLLSQGHRDKRIRDGPGT